MNWDCNLLIDNLKKCFGGDWVVILRLHPHLANIKNQSLLHSDNRNVVNANQYPDIQELLVATDIGITDYSSWIFDFMLSRKPAFIYAEDIEKYNTDRGFYYQLETTPFPIATNNFELVENIKNFDYKQYEIKVDEFLQEKGCMEDGLASKRVVDLIENIEREDNKCQ